MILSFLPVGALPTGSELLAQSQKAYDSVRTYEQDVVGHLGTMSGTAHVSFSRPGRLRVGGKSMFGTPYDLLVDGKSTWVQNMGKWSPSQSPEMGIATITGVSGNAGTLVPAMLFHTSWGRPAPTSMVGSTVTSESVAGHKLWRVRMAQPFPMSIWFDPGSHFVVRTESSVMNRTITVVFSPPKVNGPIPAGRYRR